MEMSDEEPEANTTKFLAEMDVSATPLPTKSRRDVVPSTSASESVRQEEATTASHVPVVLLESPERVSSDAVVPPHTGTGLESTPGSMVSMISGMQTQTSIPAVGQNASPTQLLASLISYLEWVLKCERTTGSDLHIPSDPIAISEKLQDIQTLIDSLSQNKPQIFIVMKAADCWLLENVLSENHKEIQSKVAELRSALEIIDMIYASQLQRLEKALPLAENFQVKIGALSRWLATSQTEAAVTLPVVDLDVIDQRLAENKAHLESCKVHHQVSLEELKRMASNMAKICTDNASVLVQLKDLTTKLTSLRILLDSQQRELQKARQESVRLTNDLQSIQQEIDKSWQDVQLLSTDIVFPSQIKEKLLFLSKRAETATNLQPEFRALKLAVEAKIARSKEDYAVGKMREKLRAVENRLTELASTTTERRRNLDLTLNFAVEFWKEHQLVQRELRDLTDLLTSYEPPPHVLALVLQQQEALVILKDTRINKIKHQVATDLNAVGRKLAELCSGDNARTNIHQAIKDVTLAFDVVMKIYNRKLQLNNDVFLKIGLVSPMKTPTATVPHLGERRDATELMPDVTTPGPNSTPADGGQGSLAGSRSNSRRHEARDGMQGASTRAQGEARDSDAGLTLLFPDVDGRNSV